MERLLSTPEEDATLTPVLVAGLHDLVEES